MNLFHESTGCACLAPPKAAKLFALVSLRTLRKWTAEIEGAKQFSHKLQATVSELTGRKLRNVIVKVIREEYAHDFR